MTPGEVRPIQGEDPSFADIYAAEDRLLENKSVRKALEKTSAEAEGKDLNAEDIKKEWLEAQMRIKDATYRIAKGLAYFWESTRISTAEDAIVSAGPRRHKANNPTETILPFTDVNPSEYSKDMRQVYSRVLAWTNTEFWQFGQHIVIEEPDQSEILQEIADHEQIAIPENQLGIYGIKDGIAHLKALISLETDEEGTVRLPKKGRAYPSVSEFLEGEYGITPENYQPPTTIPTSVSPPIDDSIDWII